MNKLKSKAKADIEEMIEREREYLVSKEVGTEEYSASQERLIKLEDKLAELEKTNIDTKHQFVKFMLEVVKVVGAGIILPVFGLVVITAQERDISYTSAMKMLISCFVPGKNKLF